MVFVCAAMGEISAQLKVNSKGYAAIGDTLVESSPFTVSSKDHSCATFIGGKKYCIDIQNTSLYGTYTKSGLYVCNNIQSGKSYKGVLIDSNGETTNEEVWGVHSIAGHSTTCNYGVLGGLRDAYRASSGVGVFGSVCPVAMMYGYEGIYAGYFYGDVRVTGALYATLLTPSDNMGDDGSAGIKVLNSRDKNEESITEKLQKVPLIELKRKTCRTVAKVEEYSEEKNDESSSGLSYVPQTKLSKKKYGLAADELKKIFPELVYEDKNGNVSINYIELVPLLVQSVNELNSRIQRLESGASTESFINSDMISLSANRINSNTRGLQCSTVDFKIPSDFQTACLTVFDLRGKVVAKRKITNAGNITTDLYDLVQNDGIYVFSVTVDGETVVAKQITLKK